jgi:putative ABC transport system substrate-binding protein
VDPLSRRQLLRLGMSTTGLALASGCIPLPFASPPRVARIGLLWSGSPLTASVGPAAFRDGLRDAGWVEGQNLIIEERTYGGDPERLPELAAELVALKPEVLLAGSADVVLAYLRFTDSIPIVFAGATDPVASGVAANYSRPGGNVTGTLRSTGGSLGPKLLELLRQIVPGLARVAVVHTLFVPADVVDWQAVQGAARSTGIDAQAVAIASPNDVERALEACLAADPQALISTLSTGLIIPATNQPAPPVTMGFALQHGLPTASNRPGSTTSGALLYYGPDILPLFRRAGSFHVDRILRGAKPADLPFEGPTVYELQLNRTTARALGIAIPADVASQVTEWVD